MVPSRVERVKRAGYAAARLDDLPDDKPLDAAWLRLRAAGRRRYFGANWCGAVTELGLLARGASQMRRLQALATWRQVEGCIVWRKICGSITVCAGEAIDDDVAAANVSADVAAHPLERAGA